MENLMGTGYVLEVDFTTVPKPGVRGTPANYQIIACLTSNGFDGSTASQSTQNKCDGAYDTSLPGVRSWSMSAEGIAVKLETAEMTSRKNFQTLAQAWVDGTVFYARWNNAAGDFVREGIVYISAYTEAAPNNDVYTFTATFTGTGKPFLTKATP